MPRRARNVNFTGSVDAKVAPVHLEQDASYGPSGSRISTSVTPVMPARETKRQKTTHDGSCTSSAPTGLLHEFDDEGLEGDGPEALKRKQGASVMMKEFTTVLPQLEDAIFETKTHAELELNGSVPCACGELDALFRCPECGVTKMVCAACLVRMHPQQLLHHVEMWDGGGFQRKPLVDVGHILYLGHCGERCPHAPAQESRGQSPKKGKGKARAVPVGGDAQEEKEPHEEVPAVEGRVLVVVDTNGIHSIRIVFCHCQRARPHYLQLVAARLFPATITRPSTVFTFAVLHNFHVHNLVSKKTAGDYYRALQKLTNNAFPNKVPDRVREFLRVVRVWRHLALRRRSGQAQQIDVMFPTRRPGSLAVRCPACPEIGVNVDKSTVYAAGENEAHKYTKFLSSDGNFKLQRKRKVDDPDDVALNAGNAYFPEDEDYREYCSHIKPDDDKCTCFDLKAVRMQNITKFKNSVISGVVAVQCARHALFEPGGVVDLTKGEGYAHTDYALAKTVHDTRELRWIILTYDVYCQYFKKITTRFATWFPRLNGLIARLGGAVPKMHIRNHIAQCQSQWSTNFTDFVAFLIGELIEGSWAELNQFAGSTKEQNHGHRHDTLDDGMSQWNWDKLISMAIRTRSLAFDSLTASTDPNLIAEWSAMPRTWSIKNGKYSSPYDAHIKQGPPTHRAAYEKLMTAELAKSLAADTVYPGDTEFIATGLRIEMAQHRITRTLKTSATDKAVGARAALRKDLNAWRVRQVERFPRLADSVSSIDPMTPEKEKLFLPSSLNEHTRQHYGMATAAEAEYKLREGHAYDALAELRQSIKTFNFNLAFKITQVQGQSANTRAQNFLRTLANDRITAADDYRHHRNALLNLGFPDNDKNLQPLLNSELWAKNSRESAKLGESGLVDPWFWTVGRPADMTPVEEKAWSVELDRVKWFRDRANRDRAVEQKETVEEEFRRTIASFNKNASAWKALEDGSSPRSGRAAYAHLKHVMYMQLAEECLAVQNSAEALSEKDRIAEEAFAAAELKKKGLSNAQVSDNWRVGFGLSSAS
ncbi:hypothetical protein B0H15DRAFT_963765 [Mycena belliarum]|uniref:CxC2-like cysteine cluster KDZ transposase-associated domain-containing protein n=1 Tax=Mycena belliarum TaxID=1033014 RepID=A0AAD6XGX6_9AGAR|nr:hypothetical protein B0H15DRAFT_963765 [Mycena belliae]